MNKQLPIPPRHIYDRNFEYKTAAQTDIRQTFERIKAAMSQQERKKVRRIK